MNRFHLSNEDFLFTEDEVNFICCEIACALDYLQTKRIVHRDVKPDNILLDERGHAHLTDFNVATRLKRNGEWEAWQIKHCQNFLGISRKV